MAHAREPITTILAMVAVALACFVVAKATWQVLLLAFVVVCFGCCLYKLIEKDGRSQSEYLPKERDPRRQRESLNQMAGR